VTIEDVPELKLDHRRDCLARLEAMCQVGRMHLPLAVMQPLDLESTPGYILAVWKQD